MDLSTELTDETISELFDALTYNGFNVDGVRNKVIKHEDGTFRSLGEIQSAIILSLTSFAKAGNNLAKLTGKVKDKKVGLAVKKRLKDIGVKNKAKDSDSITLPRMAIAFLPTYILIRKKYKSYLPKQTSVDLNVVYCDISLCGVEQIWKKKGYQEFYHEFSELISKKKDDEDDDEDEDEDSDSDDEPPSKKRKKNDDRIEKKRKEKQKKKNLMWVEVAQNGYRTDHQTIKNFTSEVISIRKNVTVEMINKSIVGIINTLGYEIDEDGDITEKATEHDAANNEMNVDNSNQSLNNL